MISAFLSILGLKIWETGSKDSEVCSAQLGGRGEMFGPRSRVTAMGIHLFPSLLLLCRLRGGKATRSTSVPETEPSPSISKQLSP